MKHCILVKFKPGFDLEKELTNIKNIFDNIDIEGVHYTEYILNCIKRDNRYDLLIRIDMDKEALSMYDASSSHHEWKDKYSSSIELKAIFDYE